LNNQIKIETKKFYAVTKYYYANLYKQAMPTITSELNFINVLLRRMIIGAGVGFKKYLRVRGVGYKFFLENTLLKINVGYTHIIKKYIPSEFYIKFSRKFKVMRLRSKSLTKLTGFLCALRALRRPDVYKGKGIRYKRDPVKRKPGKSRKGLSKKKKEKNLKKKPHCAPST